MHGKENLIDNTFCYYTQILRTLLTSASMPNKHDIISFIDMICYDTTYLHIKKNSTYISNHHYIYHSR